MKIEILGATCNVACAGPDDGRPLILVHGAANDRDAWRDLAPALATAGLRVLAPDLPGHGLSAGKAPASIEALADWLLAFADAMQLAQFAVAGHSMGSLAALELAATAGGRITHLMLLGSAVPMPVSAALLDSARTNPDAACRMVTTWSHTPGFFLNGGGGHGVWGAGKTLAVMRRNSPTLAGDLANCNQYGNGLVAAAAVPCPTLLLLGRRDRMTPLRAAQALQDALRHARRVEIADCGHAMMTEKPREVAAAMIEFLN